MTKKISKTNFSSVCLIFLTVLCIFCVRATGKINKSGFNSSVLHITYRSKEDGKLLPCVVKLPPNYCSDRKWPLLIVIHGLGGSPLIVPEIDNMVQIGPSTRDKKITPSEVFEVLELAKRVFSIDSDRVFLSGFSIGAMATFDIGLAYPDVWAGCVPVCGRLGDFDIIQNGKNLPFWIHAGQKDTVVLPDNSRKAFKKAKELGFDIWKYTEHKDMGHRFWVNWLDIEKWMLSQKRQNWPREIDYYMVDNGENCYWIHGLVRSDSDEIAKISAAVKGNSIFVNKINIADYKLCLGKELLDMNKQIRVYDEDRLVFEGFVEDGSVLLCEGKNGIYRVLE